MAATLQGQYFGASSSLPPGVNAESAGVTFSREDTQSGNTPIPIPTSPGVHFSFLKAIQLAVTGTSTTTITNRTIRLNSALATGLGVHWKTDTQANWGTTFNQQGGSKAPADTTGTNNAATAPVGWTAATLSAVQYDNTSQATSATGIGSALLLALILAVDATYAGSPGTSTIDTAILGWDEA